MVAWMASIAVDVRAGEPTTNVGIVGMNELAGRPVPGHADVFGRAIHVWRKADLLIEWGFKEGTEGLAFDGSIEATQTGMVGKAAPLPGDQRTTMTDDRTWRSPGGTGRRGIVVPVLFTDATQGPVRTIITVRTSSGGFSFVPAELDYGPILAPEFGFFVCDTGSKIAKDAKPAPAEMAKAGPLLRFNGKTWDKKELPTFRQWGGPNGTWVVSNTGQEDANGIPGRTTLLRGWEYANSAVGWLSPIAGTVTVTVELMPAAVVLPNGGSATWRINHDSLSGTKTLASGRVVTPNPNRKPAGETASRIERLSPNVAQGDVVSLEVGMHSLIARVSIKEAGGQNRSWDFAGDAGVTNGPYNPIPDAHGNQRVWHVFYRMKDECYGSWWPPVKIESTTRSAAEYLAEVGAKRMKTIRAQVREQPEQTLAAAVAALQGAPLTAPPEVTFEPPMKVNVPDPAMVALWRIGARHIGVTNSPRIAREDLPKALAAGDVTKESRLVERDDPSGVHVVRNHPFCPLGCESDRILWALDLMGMSDIARDGLSFWLESQRDDGALVTRNGYDHGHHAIGAMIVPWVFAEHYRLTGDKEWLRRAAPKLKAGADYIVKRRKTTVRDTGTPEEMARIEAGARPFPGLQPAIACGDGGGRLFVFADTTGYRSVKMLADALADVDPQTGKELAHEADLYKKDLAPVLERMLVLSPVMKARDGMYYTFHPQGFHDRGPLAKSLPEGSDLFLHYGPLSSDIVVSSVAIEAWLQSDMLSVGDARVDGSFHVLEDLFLLDHPWIRSSKKDYEPARDALACAGWGYQAGWERAPDYYLSKDDVPNFLRAFLNRCACSLKNWVLYEHPIFRWSGEKSHTYAMFVTNFRNMLVWEDGRTLWLARATPRAWLEQGKKISVRNSPTHFGSVAYGIVSDVDHGKISATVELPSRNAPKELVLRFRHPKSVPIKSVTVDGKEWRDFDKDKEMITLKGLVGTVTVTARY
jgi:hypothetical protein